MNNQKIPPAIPDWLPDSEPLPPGKVAMLFGYTTENSVHSAVARGYFPKPDVVKRVTVRGLGDKHRHAKRAFWKASTLIAEIERRQKCLAQGIPVSKNPTTLQE